MREGIASMKAYDAPQLQLLTYDPDNDETDLITSNLPEWFPGVY